MVVETAETAELMMIAVEDIHPDHNNPRKSFDASYLQRLAVSIGKRGILQAIRVARDHERGFWRIVTGESRWRAAKIAGLTHVPCLLVEAGGEDDVLTDQMIENCLRHDLSPMDQARGLVKLQQMRKCTSQELAAETGLSESAISKAKALLRLPQAVQRMIDDGRVPAETGYLISTLETVKEMVDAAEAVASGAISRSDVKSTRSAKPRAKKPRAERLVLDLKGVSVIFPAAEPLTWGSLQALLKSMATAANKLAGDGKPLSELAEVLNAK